MAKIRASLIFASAGALLAAAVSALGANLPLLSGPLEPSQIQATLNQLIQTINAGVGGLTQPQTAAVATGAGTAEQTLQTFTLPANTLASAGQGIRVYCWGTTGANANNKTMKLYFGSSVVATPTAATNAKGWFLEMIVMRRTASTQGFMGKGTVDTTSVSPVVTDGAEDLTAGVVVKCTGTDGTNSASDITANGMITELLK